MSIPPVLDPTRGYRDELRTLEDELAEAMTHLYRVGNHLARVRAGLDRELVAEGTPAPATTAPSTAPVPPPTTATAPAVPVPPPAAAPPVLPPVAPVPVALREPWWQRDGVIAKVLAAVGAGITLIGVAFLLAIAIQAGYFGPLARVLSGAVLAGVLVGAGLLVRHRQDNVVGALGLVATGFAAAYLDVLAVTRIYEWVPAPLGLALAGLVALAGLLLARLWDSQLLAVIIVLGVALLAPFVGDTHVLLVGSFLVLLTMVGYAAQVGRDWPALDVARVVPTTLYAVPAVLFQEEGHDGTVMAVVLAIFVLGTSVAGVLPGTRGRLPRLVAVLALVASGPTLLAGMTEDTGIGIAVLVGLALAHVAASLAPKEVPVIHRLHEIGLFVALLALTIAAVRAPAEAYVPLALLGLALGWAIAAALVRDRSLTAVALVSSGIGMVLQVRHLPALVSRALADGVEPQHAMEGVLVVALLLVLWQAVRRSWPTEIALARLALGAAVVLLPLPLVLTGTLLGGAAGVGQDPAGTGFLLGHALATVAWVAVAAWCLVLGLGRGRDARLAVGAGLGLIALAVGKLLFFDLSALSGIPRVLSFILAGVLLLAMGAGYAQALDRARRRAGAVDNSAAPAPTPPSV